MKRSEEAAVDGFRRRVDNERIPFSVIAREQQKTEIKSEVGRERRDQQHEPEPPRQGVRGFKA